MKSYLVTGGAGFIGSHLCDALLARGHDVYVLDNLSSGKIENLASGVKFIEGDILDYVLVKKLISRVDGCFHLAAIVSVPLCNEDLLKVHHINLTGTMNVIQSVYETKKMPIVFASSSAVYGDINQPPHNEFTRTSPISYYGALKLFAEDCARYANTLYNIPFTALRLFNVYGIRQSLDSAYSGVIPIFINQLLHDEHCKIYGDGSASRDFIAVQDVVQFFIKAMQTSTNAMRVYNVCTGKPSSINEIANLLDINFAQNMVIDYLPHKPGDILHSFGNPDLATRELGYTARIKLADGLAEFVEQVREEMHVSSRLNNFTSNK